MLWLDWTRSGGPALAGALSIVACVGCGPTSGDSAMDGDDDAASDTSAAGDESDDAPQVGPDAPTAAVDVVDALLLSTEGAIDRTSIVVHVEVSNLGVAPITAVQLRAFTFSGYASASSIVVEAANAAEALPIAPGEFATLRYVHEEDGVLFDCEGWSGPHETDARLAFTVDDDPIDAPVRGNVRCLIVD
jgi:hypothetical protein